MLGVEGGFLFSFLSTVSLRDYTPNEPSGLSRFLNGCRPPFCPTMAEPKSAKQESGTGDAPAPVPEPLTLPLGEAAPAEPYSIFTRKEKWFIVAMVAVAGFYRQVCPCLGVRRIPGLTKYSPLPANIYLPAIPKLSEAFGHSVEDLNLTVTAFLAMQGICEC